MFNIYGARVIHTEDTIYTVFPHDPNEMPHDCETEKEAIDYGNEQFGIGNYTIETT